jgi:hypothetical protein
MIYQSERPTIEAPYKISGEFIEKPRMTRRRKRVLLLAGGLGLVSAALIAAAPELGLVSAVASIVAGGASAVTTLIAKR